MLEFKFNSNILVYFLKQHILAKQHFLVFQDTVEAVLHAGKQHWRMWRPYAPVTCNQDLQGLNILTPPSGLTKMKNKTKN